MAIATIAIENLVVYAATSLRLIAANIVIVSVGTLLLAFVIGGGYALSIGFYYLLHSTVVTAALFLIADLIGTQRGSARDQFVSAGPVSQPTLLGGAFLVIAIAAIGLPPLSGFVGKALLLQSTRQVAEQVWVWPALLISSLTTLIAFSMAGSMFFWNITTRDFSGGHKARFTQIVAVSILISLTALMTTCTSSILTYSEGAARDIRKHPIHIESRIKTDRSLVHEAHKS